MEKKDEKENKDEERMKRVISMERFVPEVVKMHMKKGDWKWRQKLPEILEFEGSVLFVDISGFTPLTESLSRLGGDGAEAMRDILCKSFTILLEIAHKHGGDVIKFAGDALLIVWHQNHLSLKDKSFLCAKCALEMMKCVFPTVTHKEIPSLNVDLGIKGGMSCGKMHWLYVGREGRIEFLPFGNPLGEMGKCEGVASMRSAVVSRHMWSLVNDFFVATEIPSSDGMISLEKIVDDRTIALKSILGVESETPLEVYERMLREFIPNQVANRIEIGLTSDHFLSELRLMTIIFIGIDPPHLDSATASHSANHIQLVCHQSQVLLEKYGGDLRQVIVDDKGAVVIGIFGLTTTETDAERSVLVALDLLKTNPSQDQGGDLSIGIATGRCYCGTVGSPHRSEFSVVGDAVNLAARLMSLASSSGKKGKYNGTVFVDSRTTQLATAHNSSPLFFSESSPIQLKGKAKPMSVFSPLSSLEPSGKNVASSAELEGPQFIPMHNPDNGQTFFIGRNKERGILMDGYTEMLSEGSFRGVFITGSAGTGKTALIGSFLHRLPSDSPIIIAKANQLETLTPYYVVTPMIPKILLDIDGIVGGEHFDGNQISKACADLFTWWYTSKNEKTEDEKKDIDYWLNSIPLLNSLLAVNIPENEVTKALMGKERRERIQEFLLHIMKIAILKHGPRGLVMVIEDYHWIDNSSETVLHRILKGFWGEYCGCSQKTDLDLRLFLVVSCRPDAQNGLSQHWSPKNKCNNVTLIELEALGDSDIISLAEQTAGKSLSPTQRRLLLQKSVGNPLFAQNLAASIDYLDFKGEVPDTIEKMLLTRIDSLSVSEQLILKMSSVFGDSFIVQVLFETFPHLEDSGKTISKEWLTDNIADLAKKSFLETSNGFLASPQSSQSCAGAISQYNFSHNLLREVSYKSLSLGARIQMHQNIGKWYESRKDYNCMKKCYRLHSKLSGLVAHHFEMGNEPTKASHYYFLAGEQSLAEHNIAEAEGFLTKSLQLCPSSGCSSLTTKAGIQFQLAELQYMNGNLKVVVPFLRDALATLGIKLPTMDQIRQNKKMIMRKMLKGLLDLGTQFRAPHKGDPVSEAQHCRGQVISRIYRRLVFLHSSTDATDKHYDNPEQVLFCWASNMVQACSLLDPTKFLSEADSIQYVESFRVVLDVLYRLPSDQYPSLWRKRLPLFFSSLIGTLAESSSNQLSLIHHLNSRWFYFTSAKPKFQLSVTTAQKVIDTLKKNPIMSIKNEITVEDFMGVVSGLLLVMGRHNESLELIEEYLTHSRVIYYPRFQEIGLRLKAFTLLSLGRLADVGSIIRGIEEQKLHQMDKQKNFLFHLLRVSFLGKSCNSASDCSSALPFCVSAINSIPPNIARIPFLTVPFLHSALDSCFRFMSHSSQLDGSFFIELNSHYLSLLDLAWKLTGIYPWSACYSWFSQAQYWQSINHLEKSDELRLVHLEKNRKAFEISASKAEQQEFVHLPRLAKAAIDSISLEKLELEKFVACEK